MTGINKTIKLVSSTGNQTIDGVMSGFAWASSVTYAFPTSASHYPGISEASNNFAAISTLQKNAALFAMEQSFGGSANDGFSVEGFTNLSFSAGTAATSTLRFAQSDDASPTAYAYYPGTDENAGDVWFSTEYAGTENDYRKPVAGNYAWHTMIHELGHALGLKHGHEADEYGAVPAKFDSVEYTVMTYSGYVGDPVEGYDYEGFGAPQTFMMADIAALQTMYGADFTTKNGDTVYKWTPGNGQTIVDGAVAIAPGANRIFATIWDGGGRDTFDLTAYKANLKIDLRPGMSSLFSEDQLAFLDGIQNEGYAGGNIYNALLYRGDTRSLIENVKGGSGNDQIMGNQAANVLQGFAGNDLLTGETGNDTLIGGTGNDRLEGGQGTDRLAGEAGADIFVFRSAADSTVATTGRDTILDFLGSQGDRIYLAGIDANTTTTGNQGFNFIAKAAFTGKAGELRYSTGASDSYIYADVNGDKRADFAIHLDDAVTLQKGYFFL
ncbi:M10 family metallopeptidase [Pararhizobium gei]|uniref:M10 family metallopeptidase n=1 Tax=Pararhizobium gei TaxID=1395951 RepID=UPI0023DC0C4A|nr:M10 family metallopeptidase [Rhizobium gei]